MPDLNKDALEKAGRLANDLGWTCHGGVHEPGEYENCVDCSDGADILAAKIITAYLGALTEPLTTSKPNQNLELVESVEELGALPIGSVFFDDSKDFAYQVCSNGEYGPSGREIMCVGIEEEYNPCELDFPLTVLHTPEVQK